jgi:DNA helicase-2/ATP-dependent DNA helicase PcrA
METDAVQKIIEDVTGEQRKAIEHVESHARLLAGPGTGKTHVLTRKVLWLVLRHSIAPQDILALTFTRLAAAQLRRDLTEALKPHEIATPVVSTLHSFALRQILSNSQTIEELPRPVRIADDWEERYLIQEDLKKILGSANIRDVQSLISRLSADWETLKAEEVGWSDSFPDPKFLGALQAHKAVYGETLRAELVYKLKRSLDQNAEFKIDNDYKYVLIDEYQDLNACDLSVVRSLAARGAKVFVVGDDDQSIYGFRYANPNGIRQFPEVYDNAARLQLTTCYRCDRSIIQQAEFVADQDTQRLPKTTKPRDDAEDGEVVLIQCADQDKEAAFVAGKIKELVDAGMPPEKIVVLSKSRAIFEPIKAQLIAQGIKVSTALEEELTESKEYRIVLSLLRLIADEHDALALRTLIQLEKNGLGDKCIDELWQYASTKAVRLDIALGEARANPAALGTTGTKIKPFLDSLDARLKELKGLENITTVIDKLATDCIVDEAVRSKIKTYLTKLIDETGADTVEKFVRGIGTSSDMIEQETDPDAVSILTMHQAKGLTFDACFIVGAEDEFLPGRNDGEMMGDERRLLYVSMTRAKHKLYISYCTRRTGKQKYYGRVPNGGQEARKLTRFLADAKITTIRAH